MIQEHLCHFGCYLRNISLHNVPQFSRIIKNISSADVWSPETILNSYVPVLILIVLHMVMEIKPGTSWFIVLGGQVVMTCQGSASEDWCPWELLGFLVAVMAVTQLWCNNVITGMTVNSVGGRHGWQILLME